MKLLKLIPARLLAKYLPDILAYVLTKALGYLLLKYPEKSDKVIETSKEIAIALANAVDIAKDGIITSDEIKKQKDLLSDIFK